MYVAKLRLKPYHVLIMIPFCSQNCAPTTSGPTPVHVFSLSTADANIPSETWMSLNITHSQFSSQFPLHLHSRFYQWPGLINSIEIFQIPIVCFSPLLLLLILINYLIPQHTVLRFHFPDQNPSVAELLTWKRYPNYVLHKGCCCVELEIR